MNTRHFFTRGLAAAHFVFGLISALVAAYTAYSAFSVLAYMSTGTLWSNLPMTVFLALQYAVPFALLGGWMLMLGRRIWNGTRPLRKVLLVTHGILLGVGGLAVAIGILAVRSAEISAARGGGLLSPLAWVPLIFGIALLLLAVPSIFVALTAKERTAGLTAESDA